MPRTANAAHVIGDGQLPHPGPRVVSSLIQRPLFAAAATFTWFRSLKRPRTASWCAAALRKP